MKTARTTTIEKPTIIDPDRQTKKQLSGTQHFIIQGNATDSAKGKDVFCVLLGSTLSAHSDIADHIASRIGKPRIVFVKVDTNINSILDKISNKPWRHLQPVVLLVEKWSQVDLVLRAWSDRAPDERVALAWVEGDSLKVKSCSLKAYEIEFEKLKSLAHIKPSDRDKFEIDEFGRHLYWKDYDLHIDIIDAIRCHSDENYRKERDLRDLQRNTKYGEAVAALREKRGLTQKDVEYMTGLTDRQLRRIEREGHPITVDVAEKLSSAHKLTLQEYLQAIADTLSELRRAKK